MLNITDRSEAAVRCYCVHGKSGTKKGAAQQDTGRVRSTLNPPRTLLLCFVPLLSPPHPPAFTLATVPVTDVTGRFQSKSCYGLISKHFLAYYAIYHDENCIGLLKATC